MNERVRIGILIIVLSLIFGCVDTVQQNPATTCSNGVQNGTCSMEKPYFCDNGNLIYNPTNCGCPNSTTLDNGSCREYRNCADGTLNGECSTNTPLFCSDGNLTPNISFCGCGNEIQNGTNSCRPSIGCSDGTADENCSLNQPEYCYNGTLTDDALMCGCPAGYTVNGNSCASKYTDDTNKEFSWEYQGTNHTISLNLSSSLNSYYAGLTRSYLCPSGTCTSSDEYNYYRSVVNDSLQEQTIESILKQTNYTSLDSEDQLLDALGMVEALPYDYQEADSPNLEIRYPYQTLYEGMGVCSDKTLLGAAIAEKMGYGVALFSYAKEDHMALGIKCPQELSNYNSGYCFLEMTEPCSKLTYNEGTYLPNITLTSTPEIIPIYDGKELSSGRVVQDIDEINQYENASAMIDILNAQLASMSPEINSMPNQTSSYSQYEQDNQLIDQYNKIVAQDNGYVDMYNSFSSCN